MNQTKFDTILYRLSAKQKDCLQGFLQGKSDDEIAAELEVKPDTIRYHINKAADRFGLREFSGERCRPELVDLFVEFQADWVAPQLRDRHRLHKEDPDAPGSVMAVDSPFYVNPAAQTRCFEEIQKPGALIRIRSPHQMGKTSLLQRILATTEKLGYRRVEFNLRHDLDQSDLVGLPQFWAGFCRKVVEDLELEPKPLPTTKPACTSYFQSHVLPALNAPLVLALDEADVLFEYPEIANDFFPLLRVWYNAARVPNKKIWKQLRQVIVHSTDDYCILDRTCSPFENVGEVAKLSPLSPGQVLDLARRYGLKWTTNAEIDRLMAVVGGHPYLIQQALYCLKREEMSLEAMLQSAPTLTGIYRSHLQALSDKLQMAQGQGKASLAEGLQRVMAADGVVQLTQEQTFKLEGLGLVTSEGNQVWLSCNLYRDYFQAWFDR